MGAPRKIHKPGQNRTATKQMAYILPEYVRLFYCLAHLKTYTKPIQNGRFVQLFMCRYMSQKLTRECHFATATAELPGRAVAVALQFGTLDRWLTHSLIFVNYAHQTGAPTRRRNPIFGPPALPLPHKRRVV